MPGPIPAAAFRLSHGFAVKPDLEADTGPDAGILLGCHSAETTEALYLGKQAEAPYRNIWMDTRGAHALYVMGKRRSGKSYTLGALAEGLAAQSWIRQGEREQGVLILDTMNVYLTMPFGVEATFTAESESVKYMRRWRLEPELPKLTLFRPSGTILPDAVSSEEVSLRASDLGSEEWCGLFEADPFADPLGHLITELHAKVSTDGYVDSQSGKAVGAKPDFLLGDLVTALLHDADLQRYHQTTRESLRRRLESVRRLPVFSDQGFDVRRLIVPGQISVLLLRELDSQLRSVLVALIVKKMMQLRGSAEQHERVRDVHLARAERLRASGESPQQEEEAAEEAGHLARHGLQRCWLIIDEAHNYIPAIGMVPSRRPLKKYVDEGRNLGLSIVVATQQPSGLDPSIQRNADMLLVHSLSHRDDIQAAEGMINTAAPQLLTLGTKQRFEGARTFEGAVRNLPLGYALASTDRANRLIPVCIRPRITVHGGGDY